MAGIDPYAGRSSDFLSALAEAAFGDKPIMSPQSKLFLQSLVGRSATITNDDFSPEALQIIHDQAASAAAEGRRAVTYDDYLIGPQAFDPSVTFDENPEYFRNNAENYILGGLEEKLHGKTRLVDEVSRTLGSFAVDPTSSGYRITDTYDFNPRAESKRDSINAAAEEFGISRKSRSTASASQARYQAIRNLAEAIGPRAGEDVGIPVDFTIPYGSGERDQMNKRRFIAEMLRR